MKNIKFSERTVIGAAQATVFDYTQDYGNRLRWDTFLKRAELMDGATRAGKGVNVYCVAKNGLGMVTTYVSFSPPKATAIKMTRGPWMFRAFAGSWTFKEITADQTEVIFLYSCGLRFPFSLFAAFIRNNLQSNVRQRLRDLKANIERNWSNEKRAS